MSAVISPFLSLAAGSLSMVGDLAVAAFGSVGDAINVSLDDLVNILYVVTGSLTGA